MTFIKKLVTVPLIFVMVLLPVKDARADFWGGDIPLLIQIVTNTLNQLYELKAILGNGEDTLGLLRDVNEGIRDAMNTIRTLNTTIHPGVLSDLQRQLGRFIGTFVGGLADGMKEKQSAGIGAYEPGGLQNGLLNGVTLSAQDQTKEYTDSLAQIKPTMTLNTGQAFIIFLEQAYTP